jgi:hypothetical protein
MGKKDIQQDAKGQFAKSQGDRKNSGLASATPRTVTGKDDATLENADKKPSPNPGFAVRTQTNKRD